MATKVIARDRSTDNGWLTVGLFETYDLAEAWVLTQPYPDEYRFLETQH
jgi:hypothetical protein